MEANLSFNGFGCYQLVYSQDFAQTESQECVVPDTLPDIASILHTSGCVLIRSKDVSSGTVRLEANVPARVTCAGEDDHVFCMDVNIPFYISAEDERIPEGGVCTAHLTLKHLEARAVNPRKISVRAEIDIFLRCYMYGNTQVCGKPMDALGEIHAMEQTVPVSAPSCVMEKTFVLTDEFSVSSENSSAEEIISQNADILLQEAKPVGSKIILKGSVRSVLIYRNETAEMEFAEFMTPFTQIIETQTELEDAMTEIDTLLSGMYYEILPGTDGRSISMELHLVAQVVAFAQQQLCYLSDAYSNAFQLELQKERMTVLHMCGELCLRDSFRTTVETACEVSSVISACAIPSAYTVNGGEITVFLRVTLCWLGDGKICSMERTVSQKVCAELTEGEAIRVTNVFVQEASAIPDSDGIALRISLEIRGFAVEQKEIDAICAIRFQDDAPIDLDDKPTLVIMNLQKDDSLWELAKQNCSTVEAIRALNHWGEDEAGIGKLIMIPKTL